MGFVCEAYIDYETVGSARLGRSTVYRLACIRTEQEQVFGRDALPTLAEQVHTRHSQYAHIKRVGPAGMEHESERGGFGRR